MMDKQYEHSDDFLTADGTPYPIPKEGSLALLAMGYQGIMAWRAKKYALRASAQRGSDRKSLRAEMLNSQRMEE